LWAWAGYIQTRSRIETEGTKRPVFDPRSWTSDYYLALVFFILGLLSKSMLVTLPFVLLLLDFWPLNRLPSGASLLSGQWLKAGLALFLEKIPFLLLSAVISVITIKTQQNAVVVAHSFTIPWRIGNALLAYTDYLGHMFYPVELVVAYSHAETDPTPGRVILAVLILVAITVAAIAGYRRHPYLLVGWFWYVGTLLPVVDIMQAAHNARADRYTYLPQIGLYVMITWGLVELCAASTMRRKALCFIGAALVAMLTMGAYIQTTYWKNSETLWTRCVVCTPDNSFAYNTKGTALANQKKWGEAIRLYQRALKIEPDYPEALVNLGVSLVNLDRREEAIGYFQRALQINPYSSEAHYDLGDALSCQGKVKEAIAEFELALKCKPDHAGAHYDLGLNLAIQGKWDEAIPHYEQSFRIKLDQGDARYITGVALATQKKWAEAIDLYRQAIQLKPTLPEAHYRLGIALEAQKKWTDALSSLQQGLTLATKQGNAGLTESIKAEIKSCQAAMVQPPAQ